MSNCCVFLASGYNVAVRTLLDIKERPLVDIHGMALREVLREPAQQQTPHACTVTASLCAGSVSWLCHSDVHCCPGSGLPRPRRLPS